MAPAKKRRKTKAAAATESADNVATATESADNVAAATESADSVAVVEEKAADIQQFWLMKSEPESRIERGVDVKFGIEDLKKEPNQTACWDGVRNHQAKNLMRDEMKVGDKAFFYHSNCKMPGVAGIMTIVKEGYPDSTQFDKSELHYDKNSSKDNPKWFMVDVQYDRMMKRYIPLSELKQLYINHRKEGGPLKSLALFTQSRLSVQRMSKEEFDFIVALENEEK